MYKTKHILISCGDDFEWSDSEKLFYSLDRLIDDINAENGPIKLKYSTANEYFDAVKNSGVELQTRWRNRDFFPYN